MIDMIPDLWQFITLVVMMHVSVLVAYLLQWNEKISILQIDAFNMYPWFCEKCMVFWCNFVPNIVFAYIWDPWFALWGFVTASCLSYSVIKSKNLYNKTKNGKE